MIKKIFQRFPYVEVLVRSIYWRAPAIQSISLGREVGKHINAKPESDHVGASVEDLFEILATHGLKSDDIAILHSSMSAIKKSINCDPQGIVDRFLKFLGPNGTLTAPAIPRYPEAPAPRDRLKADLSDQVWTYDLKATKHWTGALPAIMLAQPKAKRSRFPLNSIVSIGHHAEAMLVRELEGDRPTPCGPNSAWSFCAQHNAMIIAIGVDLAHSLTMIHVAEDCYEQEWPVRNWYRDRKFAIVDEQESYQVTVRERRPEWSCHYGEQRLNRDLKRAGLTKYSNLAGLSITTIRSSDLLAFLNQRKSRGYPYFLWRMFNR